jgi:aspartate/methionine/tyrosine aminotransferase
MFSRRSTWDAAINSLTRARIERERRGHEILDLTVSNPTSVGLPYPSDELAKAMGRAARAPYDPQPLGIRTAREAVARELDCEPDDIILTASTSEAYSFLFKLLTDPGDAVLTATPSYPLLEHLAAIELVKLDSFPLEFHRRWEIHAPGLQAALTPRTRAVVLVSPNNPTGSFVRPGELPQTDLPLILDEVFRDYAFLDPSPDAESEALSFHLGGLSKSAGLPHYKLGWIRLGGSIAARRGARQALELIADNFLSIATPVQVALPDLLRIGRSIRAAIRARTLDNLRALQSEAHGSIELLPVEGGWSAVLRVPRIRSDEDLALALLDRGVLVHPGYFFDFAVDGYLVVSLLTEPDVFREGIRRLKTVAGA